MERGGRSDVLVLLRLPLLGSHVATHWREENNVMKAGLLVHSCPDESVCGFRLR